MMKGFNEKLIRNKKKNMENYINTRFTVSVSKFSRLKGRTIFFILNSNNLYVFFDELL